MQLIVLITIIFLIAILEKHCLSFPEKLQPIVDKNGSDDNYGVANYNL